MLSAPRIVFAIYERIQTLDLTGPWEVMHSAGARAERGRLRTSPSEYRERFQMTVA